MADKVGKLQNNSLGYFLEILPHNKVVTANLFFYQDPSQESKTRIKDNS